MVKKVREKIVVRKEAAKVGRVKTQVTRRACEQECKATRAQAKAAPGLDLGEKEEEIKESGSMIGGRVFLAVTAAPTEEELKVGMVLLREDKATAMMVGLVRGATQARAAAMPSIR